MSLSEVIVRFGVVALLGPSIGRDPFQLVQRSGAETFYVGYSPVTVLDSNGHTVFQGSTDKYGRIRIDLPKGSYRADVMYRDQRWTLTLKVDGSQQLKTLTLP